MFEIKQAVTHEDRKQCYALRHVVYVEEQGVPVELEIDDHDETDAIHMIGVEDGTVVATARLYLVDGVGKIGRVAVSETYRGRGYGKHIIQALMDYARDENILRLELDAQIHATGLYEKLGFKKTGDIFDDAGIDHIKMFKKQ